MAVSPLLWVPNVDVTTLSVCIHLSLYICMYILK